MMVLPDPEQRTLVCCSPHQWEALYPPPDDDDDDDDDDEVVDDNCDRHLVIYDIYPP